MKGPVFTPVTRHKKIWTIQKINIILGNISERGRMQRVEISSGYQYDKEQSEFHQDELNSGEKGTNSKIVLLKRYVFC